MSRDRVYGLGQPTDDPASGGGVTDTTSSGWDKFGTNLGNQFLGLFGQYAQPLINYGLTGNVPQQVVTQHPVTGQPVITTIPGGTKTLASATGSMPTWLIPALVGGAVLMFFMAKRK